MKKLLSDTVSSIYSFVKSNRHLRRLYYAAANSSYFTNYLEHEKMLSDKQRMDTYHRAIIKHINKDDIVIDLGTGTGILSFFASQKSPKKIYAIEHGKIIETAKKICKNNGIKNIEFINTNSRNFSISEKADFIIHEQIGALLFDEHMIENISDLKNRVLKEDGKILPGKFEVFLAPVKLKDHSKVPFLWEQNIHGIKYDCLNDLKNNNNIEADYGLLKIRPEAVDYFLSEPVKILYYDMDSMSAEDLKNNYDIIVKTDRSGITDGFCFFFNIIFDEEIILSTNPLTSITHWNIPILRTENKFYGEGEEIKFNLSWKDPSNMESYKWSIIN